MSDNRRSPLRCNESVGKHRSGRVRHGNSTPRATLTQRAYGAARTNDSQFHGFHRAILALAHKLLRTIDAILRDDHP